MPASKISPRKRAAALADLQAGEQPAVVAARHKIDPDVVRQWKARYVTADVTHVTPAKPVVKPSIEVQKRTIGELVLDLLAAKLEASAAIARAASDPAWLERQSPAELAALGQWLDSTAFAIGDRLAGSTPDTDGSTDA
jgi:hypothetical protein